MTPLIHPQLVNDPFGDPALYLEFKFERRAMMFDLGDIQPLPARKLLRVSDAFVSHAHMDHFSGFDRILRTCLGRDKTLRLFGPTGFIERVEHKLAAYSWNLVRNYPEDFAIEISEVRHDGTVARAQFRCREGFRPDPAGVHPLPPGILLDEEHFLVRATILDHGIPCLAFSLEEKLHVNVWKNRLVEMGLGVGPWLRELKNAVLRGDPDDTQVRASWRERGRTCEAGVLLGEIKERALRIVPGQKVAYVVDAVFSEANVRSIVELTRGADLLFIEAVFLDEDSRRAAERCHLTARQAGEIARQAGVRRIVPFHFSPRYDGQEERLRHEAQAAFSGSAA